MQTSRISIAHAIDDIPAAAGGIAAVAGRVVVAELAAAKVTDVERERRGESHSHNHMKEEEERAVVRGD